jgi:hypothetical protein
MIAITTSSSTSVNPRDDDRHSQADAGHRSILALGKGQKPIRRVVVAIAKSLLAATQITARTKYPQHRWVEYS